MHVNMSNGHWTLEFTEVLDDMGKHAKISEKRPMYVEVPVDAVLENENEAFQLLKLA